MPPGKSPSDPRSSFSRLIIAAVIVAELNTLAHEVVVTVAAVPFGLALGLSLSLATLGAIAVINRLLVRYFLAISARNDDYHHRPTAIMLSLGLFVLLICAYAGLYGIEMPEAFAAPSKTADALALLHRVIGAVYFSTITISTLGYGDISPGSDVARLTAALEAVNGLIAFGVFTGAVTGFMATRASEAPVRFLGKKPQSDGKKAEDARDR